MKQTLLMIVLFTIHASASESTNSLSSERIAGFIGGMFEPQPLSRYDAQTKSVHVRTSFLSPAEEIKSFQKEFNLTDAQIVPPLIDYANMAFHTNASFQTFQSAGLALLSLCAYPSDEVRVLAYRAMVESEDVFCRMSGFRTYLELADTAQLKSALPVILRDDYNLRAPYNVIQYLKGRYDKGTPADQQVIHDALMGAVITSDDREIVVSSDRILAGCDPQYAISELRLNVLQRVELNPYHLINSTTNSKIPNDRYIATELQKLRQIYVKPIANDVSVSVDL